MLLFMLARGGLCAERAVEVELAADARIAASTFPSVLLLLGSARMPSAPRSLGPCRVEKPEFAHAAHAPSMDFTADRYAAVRGPPPL